MFKKKTAVNVSKTSKKVVKISSEYFNVHKYLKITVNLNIVD